MTPFERHDLGTRLATTTSMNISGPGPSAPTVALHRHQIARLREAAWDRLLRADWDAQARACLAHWAEHGLPLVVTRQPADLPEGEIAMGLCAPSRWGRRRLALRVRWAEILYFDEFPRLDLLITQLPRGVWAPARELASALRSCGATARVFGSHGWQALSGLPHVREGSDLDLWVAVDGPAQADAAAAAMQAFVSPARRLDGELVLAGDAAVAWREWLDWRSGRVGALLVKRLRGPSLSPVAIEGFADQGPLGEGGASVAPARMNDRSMLAEAIPCPESVDLVDPIDPVEAVDPSEVEA